MTFWLLIGAAGISFFAMCFHGVLGRRMYLGNINAAEMQGRTKSLSAVSWDVFTGQLFVTGGTLLYVSYTPAAALMLYPIIAVNIVGALIFVVLYFAGHKFLLTLPGAYLQAAIAGLGWATL